MENTRKSLKIWRAVAIIVLCLLIAVSSLYALGVGWKKAAPATGSTALSLWNEGTGARERLVDYMSAVTKEGGADFIPVEDRIAVFDMDGTLTCETFYTYYDIWMILKIIWCMLSSKRRAGQC